MPGRARRGDDPFDDLFRSNLLGSGAWERTVARKTITSPDRTTQGDRAPDGTTPHGIGTRPIAPNAGEFDAIALNEEDLDEGAATEATREAAPITLVPTSTTNPHRPRTVAAGYLPRTKTLSTIFRDGTLYNYYEVTPLEWANFKRARSKGRFILTYLDAKPRGFPIEGPMSEFARATLESVRATQVAVRGFQPGQSTGSRRGARGAYRSGNLGGTARRRNQ